MSPARLASLRNRHCADEASADRQLAVTGWLRSLVELRGVSRWVHARGALERVDVVDGALMRGHAAGGWAMPAMACCQPPRNSSYPSADASS